MVEVSGARIRTAFNIFRKAYGSSWRNARGPFKLLVYVEHFNKYRYLLTEVEATRVRNMLGDNGHAYCKALIAKLLTS